MLIAPKTVANHVSAIFAKLQVVDRGGAIILARDAGLGGSSAVTGARTAASMAGPCGSWLAAGEHRAGRVRNLCPVCLG